MRWLVTITFGMALGASTSSSAADPAGDFFESRVRPILVERCQQCHGANKQESGLRLDSREALLKGGNSGPAIVVGKPDESLLFESVKREGFEMPPDEELADEEIAALETWIRAGAVWPGGGAPSTVSLGDQPRLFELAPSHWAFQPVQRPPLPEVEDTGWLQSPIDAFILARLESEGLAPAPPADRPTLLRRVMFDLLGLPPTEREIADFENDPAPDAFARVVDRLLDLPQYGERWGRHWLDVARYADTRDFIAAGADRRYPYAYTYRDWVIAAFNRDLPYDTFIRQQLAADFHTSDPHSPDLAALGFLTVGPRFRNNQHEQIADRIDVVSRGFLGLAVTCARCHDHKYDPIPTTDYYALYGVFASCEEPDEMPRIANEAGSAERNADYERARAEKQAAFDQYAQRLRQEAHADLRSRFNEYLLGYYEMSVAKTESVRGLLSSRKLKETAITPLAGNLDRLRRDGKRHSDPVLGPLYHQLLVNDNNFAGHLQRKLRSGLTGEDEPQPINPIVLAALRDDPPKDKRDLLVRYGQLLERAEQARQSHIEQSKSPADALPDADLEQIRQAIDDPEGPFTFSPAEVLAGSRLLGPGRQAISRFENAIKEVDISHPAAPDRAFVLVDKSQPVDPVVFLRGQPNRRGDAVPRRFLTVLAPDGQPFRDGSGRSELADAIADRSNPLTARVQVNRVWQGHFGQGLVDTPGDFGFRSSPPSHPELLDWLAAEFMDNGWSIKHLHRQILLSAAYRQSSMASNGDAELRDPENRLLWRASRRRLDFESMRDAMLFASGQLDASIGGRGVSLSERPFTARRTVYGFVDRLNLDPIFSTFDFASPDASTPARAETTVPQQALFGMNHPLVIEQARALCGSPDFASLANDNQRLRHLYARVYGRSPSAKEVQVARGFLASAELQMRAARAVAPPVWQYGYGPADPNAAEDESFQPFAFFTGEMYQVSQTVPDPKFGHLKLHRNGGAPGRNQEVAAKRRWTAPRDMTVKITGTLTHLSDKGDGIRARIVVPGGQVLGQWQLHNEKLDASAGPLTVSRGQNIDFVVDCYKTGASDAFAWAPQVREVAEGGDAEVWDARADFAPPPPPPLGPWQQLAQALLLTNEFLFLD